MTEFSEEWIRLNNFKHAMKNEVGDYIETDLDKRIIDRQLTPFIENSYPDKKDIFVLDIGCGQGYAMKKFIDLGYTNTQGVTISKAEWDHCKDQGLNVHLMDYNYSKLMDNFFHLIWMRQSLQFSQMPFFTFLELNRIMKINAYAYIEIPSSGNQQKYYATLHPDNYKLFAIRSGFEIIQHDSYELSAGDQKENHIFFALCKRKNVKVPEIND